MYDIHIGNYFLHIIAIYLATRALIYLLIAALQCIFIYRVLRLEEDFDGFVSS